MNEYDVVVIGSGLGGLVSGLILSKEGMKVCVLEQHHKVGGNLQTFSRDGCIFDTGMHYIGSMAEGQYLHKYFKYLGIADKLHLRKLDTVGFDTITFDGDDTAYQMAQGYDRFVSHLASSFPEERKGLEYYVKEIRGVVNNFPLYDASAVSSYKIDVSLMEKSAVNLIDKSTSNKRLKNILAGALSLYAGHPDSTPLYIHACMRDSLINSSWRPVDGSQQIADHLAEGIKRNGGSILCSHKVVSFDFEADQAKAAVMENGDRIFGKRFISNAHPATTLRMIEEGKIKKVFRKRIMGLENSWGVFSLYAVLKENSFPYLNKNYFHYKENGILEARNDEESWPDNYYFYTPLTTNTKMHAESIVVMADMKFEEVEQWVGTSVNRRGESYKAFKVRKAEQILTALEKRLPGIKNKIVKYYTSSPLSFQDYTGTERGSAYGIIKDCKNPVKSIILPRTKISNLFFTGQNLNLHGVLGVTASAVITCSEIVGLEYLTKKISNG